MAPVSETTVKDPTVGTEPIAVLTSDAAVGHDLASRGVPYTSTDPNTEKHIPDANATRKVRFHGDPTR